MKFKIIMLLLLLSSLQNAENIKPLTVSKAVTAGGAPARSYVVLHTTIQKNPNENDSTPIVNRAVIGKIPVAVNKQLKVPEKLTDLQGDAGINITQMTGMISQTIGAVGAQIPDPTVKAATAATAVAVGTLGVLTDQGMRIAGKLMDKFYGKDPSLVSMIEIIPEGYYTIDQTSGKVSVTKTFEADLEKLAALQTQYQPALQAFNDAYLKYIKEYNKATIALQDASEEEEDAIINNLTTAHNALESLARAKAGIEKKLANLQMHRLALMRYNLPQLGTCGGAGSGPALLRLFVFLGAKQTNVYDIPYCAPNPNADLHANIEFMLPYFDNNGAYHDGGVRLVCPDGTINFQGLTASQDLAYGYTSSHVYNFYDTMLTAAGEGYEQYLIPFNMYKLQADLDAAIKEADAKKDAEAKSALSALLSDFSSSISKANQEGFGGVNAVVSDQIKIADETPAASNSEASSDVPRLSDIEAEANNV